jgi:hypothetical protein
MRRGKLSSKSIMLVILAGFLSLLSFFLDQQVIQKEDTIRNIEIDIQNKIEKVNELSTNGMTVLLLEDRAQLMTNYYSLFSTLFYKISLNLEKDDDFKKHFSPDAKYIINDFILVNTNDVLLDLQSIRYDLTSMSFYHYKYQDKAIQDKVDSLFLFENPLKESFLKKIINNYTTTGGVENFSSNEIYEMYKSLFKLNKQFAISIKKLNDISNFFDKEEERETSELDLFTLNGKKAKILKNYFILTSILFQILSLMALLFLFRNLILEKKKSQT